MKIILVSWYLKTFVRDPRRIVVNRVVVGGERGRFFARFLADEPRARCVHAAEVMRDEF